MASGENPVWLPDYGLIDMDDVGNFAGDFPCTVAADEFYSALGAVPEISSRTESCGAYGSKASREKLRRDKLNDRFLELGCLLEPGKKPKTDKSTILCDAIRVVNQLRNDAEKRKEENEQLEEKVKELKAEKSELREEKLKLKADKERLEQQMKAITMPAGFLPHPAAFQAAFAAQAPAPGVKPMPFMGYPAMPMWQFLPPALVDSSKDPAGVSPGA
ncbi:transcription factor bHLH115-like isoform X3 [Nymphaea colorata]|uniref:transcription factor bHLH115-like isoform X3 n=1 Tax=Nymphaea colorata TaxID=210225 RepID=UPI00129E2D89|nr:transcription factor bHLH115-like isoform X3 [Nymphaea colorata]